jgi:hypothetical protein
MWRAGITRKWTCQRPTSLQCVRPLASCRGYHPLIIFSCQPFYSDVMDCEQLERGMEWQGSQYYQRTGR